ncbi:phosphoribosyltransferase domain-containing protein [Sphingomonas sp. 3-13AW]|uniref:phosphoribosyltransferase domain-containing protein n=1 Tax=Sphingomonas sp. 3-13AW TaxID=3050450 RepID=UPI003BB4B39C
MKEAMMRIVTANDESEVAVVVSPHDKASALEALAKEDGYSSFAAYCTDRGWSLQKGLDMFKATPVYEEVDVPLLSGNLHLSIHSHHEDWPLQRLSDFGARANPKRGFLIVSKVLGRHIPACPSDFRQAMNDLSDMLPSQLPGPVLIVGMAETATALGQGVHAGYVGGTGRDDVYYVQSTRQVDWNTPLLAFEEAHSHATSHLILQPRTAEMREVYRTARTLIIVDDECSTGNTFLESATALLKVMPAVQRIETAVLTDWSGGEYLDRMPRPATRHYLLAGKLTWTPDPEAVARAALAASSNGHGKAPKSGTPARYGIRDPHEGVPPQRELLYDLTGRRVLVLGECEFTYPALLLAEKLADAGNDVRIQAITRSPVMEGGAIGDTAHFDDPYGSGAPCFLYNALTPTYDDVVVVSEVGRTTSDVKVLSNLRDRTTRVFGVVYQWDLDPAIDAVNQLMNGKQ